MNRYVSDPGVEFYADSHPFQIKYKYKYLFKIMGRISWIQDRFFIFRIICQQHGSSISTMTFAFRNIYFLYLGKPLKLIIVLFQHACIWSGWLKNQVQSDVIFDITIFPLNSPTYLYRNVIDYTINSQFFSFCLLNGVFCPPN